jgi:hypothetical protein
LLLITFFTFSFVFIGLVVYSFISMLWIVVVVYYITRWIRRILRRPTAQLRPNITKKLILFSFFLFVTIATSIAVNYLKQGVNWSLVGYFLFTGFLINCLVITSPLSGESDRSRLLFAFIGLPILMLFWSFSPQSDVTVGSLLNRTMTALSFRSGPDQLVTLNEQAYRKVSGIAAYAGVTLFPCQVGKDFWVLREARLVWRGIGTTAYLRIGEKPDASVLMPLPNDGVGVLDLTGTSLPQHCASGSIFGDLRPGK